MIWGAHTYAHQEATFYHYAKWMFAERKTKLIKTETTKPLCMSWFYFPTHFQFCYWKLSMAFNLTLGVYWMHALIPIHHNLYRNLCSHTRPLLSSCFAPKISWSISNVALALQSKCAPWRACVWVCVFSWLKKKYDFLVCRRQMKHFNILQSIWHRTSISSHPTDFRFYVLKQSQPKNCIKCVIKIWTQIERKNCSWFVVGAVCIRSIKFANIFRIKIMCVLN